MTAMLGIGRPHVAKTE